ncbi:MAG TPA: hypothetical protein VIZ68_03465, partial [Thermoplasmata archaeon]
MSRVRSATARLIYDSRGRPTVEVRLETDSGAVGIAGAPSGASTGTHEVAAFPEGGVPAALKTFGQIVAPGLIGADVGDQAELDGRLHALDGTPNFARIGGNTATASSIAGARANAAETGRELWEVLRRPGVTGHAFPAIVGNCLNGGRHAIGG